ncbi:adenylylsulfate kinase ApsK [Terriglobus roseus DSM 18391]|uniref:Adenylyl-sulfate kinase n=1 Tax=Terriglobus roseus (strain DSM 18391 / NRRL B-41598 / KBS 63) TaxID=926566 RepID=I3ZDW4_TERRK|nr:adenylyl-sulfate kinase [Terriglobus roseus]AFL87432.1 adenylylsulfate kinase ApsK [Terriglobus roseus DSM 18391]
MDATPLPHHTEISAPTIWFTGLSGSGKSTLAAAVAAKMMQSAIQHQVLDADRVRKHLCPDLGFSDEDRHENIRRLVYVAEMLSHHGITTLVAAISPLRRMRELARETLPNFMEVFVDAPLQVCRERDPIGLYRRFHEGAIRNLSGVDSPYETPLEPEVHCHTDRQTIEDSAGQVMKAFMGRYGGMRAWNHLQLSAEGR